MVNTKSHFIASLFFWFDVIVNCKNQEKIGGAKLYMGSLSEKDNSRQ